MIERLFDGAVDQLSRGLTHAARRHALIVQNLANIETPGYRSRDLVFEDHLGPLIGARSADAAPALPAVGPQDSQPRVVLTNDGAVKADGNDVQLDRQMARLAQNTLFHNALSQVLASQFNALKQAISGRV